MTTLSDSLQKVASNKIKSIINILAKKPWASVLVGLLTTMIIQSSSATSVMTVGFVNAGLMTLKTAIGIIMGANIGTTITAQIVSFNVVDFLSYPLIIIGFIMFFVSKRRRYKNIGMSIIGLGLLFLGMNLMKESLEPLRNNIGFKNFLLIFSKNPFLGILAGLIITSILQSSSATIGLLIALASQGLMPINSAVPILFGDNLGTCATALIASTGTTVTARRTAFAHLLFNIFGTIFFLIILYGFKLGNWLFPHLGGNVPHQIANMHTLFNVTTTIILFPIIGYFEKLVIKLYPGKDIVEHKNAIYLDNRLINTPAIALDQASKELLRLLKLSKIMLEGSFARLKNKDINIEKKVLDKEAAIDSVTEDIIKYLTQVSRQSLTLTLSNKLTSLMHAAYTVERTGDHAESMLYLVIVKEENRMIFSNIAMEELENLNNIVNKMFDTLIQAIEINDLDMLKECENDEIEIDKIVKDMRLNHIKRLQQGICMPLSGVVFSDIILHFERIGDLLYDISRNMTEVGF